MTFDPEQKFTCKSILDRLYLVSVNIIRKIVQICNHTELIEQKI